MLLTSQATRRLARELVANYGEDAVWAAEERAAAMDRIGNSDAAQIWTIVTEIVRRMSRSARRLDA